MSNRSVRSDVRSAAAWRRSAATLLDQQLWCFGYDIRRAEGNLLIAAGCTRIAAPVSSDCSSCYQVKLDAGRRLTLRGFGMLCEDTASSDSVFLRRDAFEAIWMASRSPALPWHPDDVPVGVGVPPAALARAARLIAPALQWIANYERLVTKRLGVTSRQRALDERGKPVAAKASDVSRRWQQIATELACQPDLIASPRTRRKPKRRRAARALSPR